MKFPNWFKILWWVLLLVITTYLTAHRHGALISGQAVPGDFILLLIWIALLLAPLYQEVDLFGFRLKRRIDEVSEQLASFRAEVRNSISLRTEVSPTFHIPAPPLDARLPELEQRFRGIVDDALREHGISVTKEEIPSEIPDDAVSLFKIRYQIEREIGRIWEQRMSPDMFARPRSVIMMATDLANEGFIDHRLVSVIRDVYAVASHAVHAKEVSKAQVSFMQDVAPGLIAALKTMH